MLRASRGYGYMSERQAGNFKVNEGDESVERQEEEEEEEEEEAEEEG